MVLIIRKKVVCSVIGAVLLCLGVCGVVGQICQGASRALKRVNDFGTVQGLVIEDVSVLDFRREYRCCPPLSVIIRHVVKNIEFIHGNRFNSSPNNPLDEYSLLAMPKDT